MSDPGNIKALERARADLDAGRPDLARTRITGYLYTLHRRGEYHEAAYALLGETCAAMRDYAAAGAAWLLTEHAGPEVDRAVEAFHARYGKTPANVLHALKPRAPGEAYPPAVRERLKGLGYRYRPYKPRSNPHVLTELETEKPQGVRPVEVGCLFFVIFVAGMSGLLLLRFFGFL